MKSIVALVAAYVACIVSVNAQPNMQSKIMDNATVINLTEKIYYQLDSIFTYTEKNGSWLVDSKTVYIYNQQQKVNESYTQAFTSNTWVNRNKIVYSYSDNNTSWGKQIKRWNQQTSEWNNIWKKEFIQDQNNGKLNITYSEYSNGNNWADIWQQEQNYNSQGQLSSYHTKKHNTATSQMENYWNYNCQYDSEGNLLQINNQSFDKQTGEPINEYECVLEYNSTGLISEQVIDWDPEASEWKALSRNTIDNSQSKIIIKVSESWNEELGDWIKTMRLTETYDNNDKVFEVKRDYWDSTQDVWIPHRIDNIVYNADGIKTEEVTFYPNSSLNTWESHSRIVYHYKKIGDSEQVPNEANEDLVIYPNPTNSEINLKFTGKAKELRIYSIDGILVLQQQVPTIYQSINVSELESGVYIAIVILETGQARMKFIKN